MPYFVYKQFPNRSLQGVGEHAQFAAAKAQARSLRESLTVQDNCVVKVIFAKDSAEAETLLLTPRERPILMEHEK
jgi:predicted DNA binding protein